MFVCLSFWRQRHSLLQRTSFAPGLLRLIPFLYYYYYLVLGWKISYFHGYHSHQLFSHLPAMVLTRGLLWGVASPKLLLSGQFAVFWSSNPPHLPAAPHAGCPHLGTHSHRSLMRIGSCCRRFPAAVRDDEMRPDGPAMLYNGQGGVGRGNPPPCGRVTPGPMLQQSGTEAERSRAVSARFP